ncbi:MAG TPA: hypothetical protein VFX76_11650 [Roseiflexaceae bacterium]|nr:hypothetical protein [Roseiflexaceae bacterium]
MNGTTVTYRITVTNTASVPVTITQIQDTLDLVVATDCQSPSGGVCTLPLQQPGGTLTWDGSVNLNSGEIMELVITGQVTGAQPGAQVCNTSYTVRWNLGQPVTQGGDACFNAP